MAEGEKGASGASGNAAGEAGIEPWPEGGKGAAVAAEMDGTRVPGAGRSANEGMRADNTAGERGGTAGAVVAAPRRTGAERWSEGEAKAAVATESSRRDTGEKKTVSERDRLVADPMGADWQSGGGRTAGDKTPESGKGALEAPSTFERGLLPAKSNEFIVPYTIKQQEGLLK